MSNQQPSAFVIGSGIAGLAITRALCKWGYKGAVFERNQQAFGASIRNFGMIWPIGQPDGPLLEAALWSRGIWKEICEESGIWYSETGSLHLAYQEDELAVLEGFATHSQGHGNCTMLSQQETLRRSPARSEEHTSELQSLMRISYAVFCLKTKKITRSLNITKHILRQKHTKSN